MTDEDTIDGQLQLEELEADLTDELVAALAKQFGTTPDKVSCWVIAIEHDRGGDQGLTLSAAVSPTAQPWLSTVCAEFLKKHADSRW